MVAALGVNIRLLYTVVVRLRRRRSAGLAGLMGRADLFGGSRGWAS